MTPAVPRLPSCGSAPSGWDSKHTLGACRLSTVPCGRRRRGRNRAFGCRWASSTPHARSGRSRSVGGPPARFSGCPGGTAAWPRRAERYSLSPARRDARGCPLLDGHLPAVKSLPGPPTAWVSHVSLGGPSPALRRPLRRDPQGSPPPLEGFQVEEPQRGFGRALLPAPRIRERGRAGEASTPPEGRRGEN